MLKKINMIFFSIYFTTTAMAEEPILSGAVNNIELHHNKIVINNHPYKISNKTIIYNSDKLKRGSVVEFTLHKNNVINKLKVKPNLNLIQPPKES